MRAHSKQWEALQEATSRDSATITQLTLSKDQLEEEVKERREHVQRLEALLQEVRLGRARASGC